MLYYDILETQLGDIAIVANQQGICEITFQQGKIPLHVDENYQLNCAAAPAHLNDAKQQLIEYFAKQRQHFDLPLAQSGTPFQNKVWQALQTIEQGHTFSYGQLANAINNPKAVRAVGTANGANRIAIVVPCHRVIGSDKKLTGYAGGMGIKAKLLMHEGAHFRV